MMPHLSTEVVNQPSAMWQAQCPHPCSAQWDMTLSAGTAPCSMELWYRSSLHWPTDRGVHPQHSSNPPKWNSWTHPIMQQKKPRENTAASVSAWKWGWEERGEIFMHLPGSTGGLSAQATVDSKGVNNCFMFLGISLANRNLAAVWDITLSYLKGKKIVGSVWKIFPHWIRRNWCSSLFFFFSKICMFLWYLLVLQFPLQPLNIRLKLVGQSNFSLGVSLSIYRISFSVISLSLTLTPPSRLTSCVSKPCTGTLCNVC